MAYETVQPAVGSSLLTLGPTRLPSVIRRSLKKYGFEGDESKTHWIWWMHAPAGTLSC